MKENLLDNKEGFSLITIFIIAGGLGLGLSFPPNPFPFLAWVALIPFLFIWDRSGPLANIFGEIYTSFLLAYAVAFFRPLLPFFSEAPMLPFGSLLLGPLLLTLPFVASKPILRSFGRVNGLLALVAFYLTVEFFLGEGPKPFPFPLLGHTQGNLIALNQFVELTGVAGLSFWVLVINGLCFSVLMASSKKLRNIAIYAIVALFAIPLGFSQLRRSQFNDAPYYLTVGIVQPSMDDNSWTARYGNVRMERLFELSEDLLEKMNAPPVFMIWPEMAIPAAVNLQTQEATNQYIQAWVDTRKVALLTGAFVPNNAAHIFSNSAILYQPYGPTQRYDQTLFLPFRPSIPLKEDAPWLHPPMPAEFVPGSFQYPLAFDDFRAGILLGYELLIGEYTRRYPAIGVDFLVTLTHDSAWSGVLGVQKHYTYHRLRAIETRRTIVQVSSSGKSAIIGPDGSIIFASSKREAIAQLAAIPLQSHQTIYTLYGNWLSWGFAGLSSFFFFFALYALVRQIKNKEFKLFK